MSETTTTRTTTILAQVAIVVRSAPCNSEITGTPVLSPCPHNVGRALCVVACSGEHGCLAHSVDSFAFDVSTQVRWFVSLLPRSLFRHPGMELGVGGSAVACRCLRVACVRLPSRGLALPLACCDACRDAFCCLDPPHGLRASLLRLCEDLFQPLGVPQSQAVAWPVRGLAPGVALPSSGLAHAGFENVSDGQVSGFAADSENQEPRVRLCKDRYGGIPTLLVLGMPLVFSKRYFTPTGCCLEKTVLENLAKLVFAGEIEGNNVVWGSVLDGNIASSSHLNGLLGDSSSYCSEASEGAAVIVEPDDCGS